MFRPTILRLAKAAKLERPITIHNNPYKAQKEWPPDFSQLPLKYQFNLERRLKRRSALKWARPGWNRGVKLFGQVTCTGIFIYAILFMEWKDEFGQDDQPFQGLRDWMWGSLDSIWTSSSKPISELVHSPEKDSTSE